MKLSAETITEFVADMQELEAAGDMAAVDAMSQKLLTDFKGYGRGYTRDLVDAAASYITEESPSAKIAAMDKIGLMVNEPNTYFQTQPNYPEQNPLVAAGKAALGAMVRPFAGPKGKASFDKYAESQGSANPLSTGVGQLVGGMIPEATTQSLVRKAMGPFGAAKSLIEDVKDVGAGGAAGATMGAADEEQSILEATLGGAAGTATGQAVRNRTLPRDSNQPKATQDLVTKQQDKGYWASPGYQSGRKSAEQLDNAIKKRHTTADAVNDLNRHNRKLLNSEVAKAVGLKDGTTNLDIDTLTSRNDQLNSTLDDFYATVEPVYTKSDKGIPNQAKTKYRNATGVDTPKEFDTFTKRFDSLVTAPKPISVAERRSRAKQLRSLTRDLSKRMTYHYTDPNGNRELAGAYRDLQQSVERGVRRTTNRKDLEQWKDARTQQALLLDLVANDKRLLQTGDVTPATLLKLQQSGKTRNMDYVNRRRDLWDSARFISNQERALDNSLAVNQRLGHYLSPSEATGLTPIIAAAGGQAPFFGNPLINMYLHGDYMRKPKHERAMRRTGLLGGAAGIEGAQNLDMSILGLGEEEREEG